MNLNYANLPKPIATALYRRRYRDHVLRYAETHEMQMTTAEQLLALLDQLSDEELEQYIARRRSRSNSTTAKVNVHPWLDIKTEKIAANPGSLPRGTIGDLNTASRGSVVGNELGSDERGTIDGRKSYSKAVNDKALQYCKRQKQRGEEHVDYGYALEQAAAGALR